jgi:rhodanese-related sulfurtransferase
LPRVDGATVDKLSEFDEGPYDVLTSNAGGRWRWIDVRPDSERKSGPVRNTHAALPLDRLLHGDRLPYDVDASLAVFGQGIDDTARAVEELRRRGYRKVLALSGEHYGGYEWLVHADLITRRYT